MTRAALLPARSRSASAKTMLGDFPPSSRVTGTTLSAAAFITAIPVGTEPVKVIWLIPGCPASAAPATSPRPVSTLKTPLGSPASSASSARRSVERTASSAGLATTVLPQASAGAIPRAARRRG